MYPWVQREFAQRVRVHTDELLARGPLMADRRLERMLQNGLRAILIQMVHELGSNLDKVLGRYSFRIDGLTPDDCGECHRPSPVSRSLGIRIVDSMHTATKDERKWSNRECWGPEVQFRGEW